MNPPSEITFVEATLKSSPAVVVSGLTLCGVSLNEAVLILTLVYTVLQTYFLIRDKAFRPWKEKREAQRLAKGG